MASVASIYRTARWKVRVSPRKLAKDYICEACWQRPARQVHHIHALKDGGAPFDPQNLMSCCVECHNEATACEKAGKHWVMAKDRGVDAHGNPRDPAHPWAVQSL